MASYQTDTLHSSRRLRENIERRENERLSRSIVSTHHTPYFMRQILHYTRYQTND